MVGIECDGRAFHMDEERDAKRETVLVRNGWTIYRIEGWRCNQNWDEVTGKPPFGRELANHIGESHGIRRREKPATGSRLVGEIANEMMARLLRAAT